MRLAGFTKPSGPAGPDLGPKIQAAIGKAIRDAGASNTEAVVDGNITEADRPAIQTVIDSYTLDPNWGVPQEDVQMDALRSKARDVFNQTDTFTATQLQRILAMLVLRETR